jgi:hypothetical protein
MTTAEPVPLIDYGDALDARCSKLFGIDTCDAGIEADVIAAAQEEGDTPEDYFALWLGEKYCLILISEWGCSSWPRNFSCRC